MPKFVLGILIVNNLYVMQLRDNKPTISDPNVWALFGGKIEIGELPRIAFQREIQEELSISTSHFKFLTKLCNYNTFIKQNATYWVYESDVSHLWHRHVLMEGQDVGLFDFQQLLNLPMPNFIRQIVKKHRYRWRNSC